MVRLFYIAPLVLWLVAATGCATAPVQEEQIWEQLKIGDIGPPADEAAPKATFLGTVHMDVHLLELPAANVDKLDDVWEILSAKPLRMNSYNAFRDNGFRVRFGRLEKWQQIESLLAEAGGQKTATMSLVLTDNETSDLPIADLPAERAISFVGTNLSRQTAKVGPGGLVLRLRPEFVPYARGVRKIIAYPVYTLPMASAIEPLQLKAREHEFYFASAAFAAEMGPGHLVVLGPDEYTGERITLGGLFFSNPDGSLFFDPDEGEPPRRQPAARLYVLVCTNISD